MTSLRAAPHTPINDTLVEVWRDGEMVAVIYPQPNGVRIVSEYLENTRDLIMIEVQNPPALLVNLTRRKAGA